MAIDIGNPAIDRASYTNPLNTYVDLSNAANASGYLDSFEIWLSIRSSDFKVGTFYYSGGQYVPRDYEYIGNVNAGSKQTFTGRNCTCNSGDYIGFYTVDGSVKASNSGGSGLYYVTYTDCFDGAHTYTYWGEFPISVYATGVAAPTVTTQAATDVTSTSCTGNGNITATDGVNATRRGFCYKVGTSGDPTTADSVAYDDGSFSTGAYTKAITGLRADTSYRVRSYAVNSAGTSYGSTVTVLTKPAAPTNIAASENNSSKVTVTWTKSTGATSYDVYCDGTKVGSDLGDVATYDDTGADAPTITAGAASASDGTNSEYVALSLSGASIANGTTHTYKVVAKNATGDSADSATDTGYRLAGSLSYQWQRSAADSDASYSEIPGATTASYNDIGISSDGSGRYYKCVLSANGSVSQNSTPDRGYRASGGLFVFNG